MHALQNTIDWCINSATDLCGYVLEHRFTKFSDITQCNGHYAVQRNSMSPILVPIESSYLPSYTVSKLRLIIGEIFANERGVLHFNALAGVMPCQCRHKDIMLKLDYLAYIFAAESIGGYFQPLLRNLPRKLPNSVQLRGG